MKAKNDYIAVLMFKFGKDSNPGDGFIASIYNLQHQRTHFCRRRERGTGSRSRKASRALSFELGVGGL